MMEALGLGLREFWVVSRLTLRSDETSAVRGTRGRGTSLLTSANYMMWDEWLRKVHTIISLAEEIESD